MNRDAFFGSIRKSLFGKLTQKQVDGLNTLLSEWERSKYTNTRWLAYCLATAYHETAHTMQPVSEYGGTRYLTRMYDITGDRPYKARELGNLKPGEGALYAGRGYVQITGKNNYNKASKALGMDLVRNPDKALDPKIAAFLLYTGCAEGWWTGKKLGDYITSARTDYVNARRVVNGTDRAKLIAEYAIKFERALRAAGATSVVPKKPKAPTETPSTPSTNWLVELIKAIGSWLKGTQK